MINISLPITDDGSQCNSGYRVEYKRSIDTGYTLINWVGAVPIEVYNLEEATTYNFRVTRNCCDGAISSPNEFDVYTGLETPLSFTASAGDSQVTLVWDDMPDATNYIIERDTVSTFTAPTEVHNGAWAASVVDSPLSNGTTYYYRIKSQASGYPDSLYAYDDATPST